MSAQKGSAFLLKIGDGGEPPAYQTVAGLRTTQMSINGDGVVVTHKDSGGWRELCHNRDLCADPGWRTQRLAYHHQQREQQPARCLTDR